MEIYSLSLTSEPRMMKAVGSSISMAGVPGTRSPRRRSSRSSAAVEPRRSVSWRMVVMPGEIRENQL